MFKDVQLLKIKETQAALAEAQKNKEQFGQTLRDQNEQLWKLEANMQRGVSGYHGKKSFNVFEKLITHRGDYKKYQAWLAEYQKLPEKIQKLKQEIEQTKIKTQTELEQSGILQDIQNLEDEIYNIKKATTLGELGIKPLEAISMLEANGIVPVLDESDREIFERPRNYQGKEDLIMVHKTAFIPHDNRISTRKEANVQRTEKVNLDGKDYEFSYLVERDTIHTSINDEVSSHFFGDWEDCRYAILQPMAEVPSEQIAAAVPNDTYTKGGINLTNNAWVLCPVAEVDNVKKENPAVHVLGYQGENVKGLAAPFLSQLGYRAEKVGQWGWEDSQSQDDFYQIAQKDNMKITQHYYSTEADDEQFLINLNKLTSIMKMLRDNNLVQSAEDYQRIKTQLEKQVDFKNCLCFADGTNQEARGQIGPDAIIGNGRQFQVIQQRMSEAKMPLPEKESAILKTAYDDSKNRTNLVAEKFGIKMPFIDIFERAMVNSMMQARTIETERSM